MTARQEHAAGEVPLVRLESDHLAVDVAPSIGGRIVNLTHKPSAHQFLWHNPRLRLARAEPGNTYDPNFYGGIDEIIPVDIPETVDGIGYPDHGELWPTPLGHRFDGQTLVLEGLLPLSGLRYRREMRLDRDGPAVHLNYAITNTSGASRAFLWKLHAALAIEPGDRIDCPAGRAVAADVAWARGKTAEPFDWPEVNGQRADMIPQPDGTTDFLFLYELREGRVGWRSGDGRRRVEIRFDPRVFPYVCYFASYGGLDGHVVAVLEPCTAMPLLVMEAQRLGQCSVLASGQVLSTDMTITADAV